MPGTIKACLINGATEGSQTWIDEFRKLGHTLTIDMDESYDVVILGTVSRQDLAWLALEKFPDVPLITYCWDFYKWALEGKNPGYDWLKYKQLLYKSKLVLVPSRAQQRRLWDMLGCSSEVLLASVDVYEHEVSNDGYVLDPVRTYPDENAGWVERACSEIGIPYVHSEHGYTQEQFRDLVSRCSFMTCAYREASTGGLSLVEGLWNGKVSLVSDSPYMGASDYLGEFGYYFDHTSYDSLKEMIQKLWFSRKESPKAKDFISKNFQPAVFASGLEKHIYDVLRVS